MSIDSRYQVTYQRPSYHSFVAVSITNLTTSQDISVNCPFPVKEIRIGCSYTGKTDNRVSVYAIMPNLFPGSDVVATFTDNIFTQYEGQVLVPPYAPSNQRFYYSSTMDKTIPFLFREPQMITNSYAMNFASVGNVDPGNMSFNIVFHFECLG